LTEQEAPEFIAG